MGTRIDSLVVSVSACGAKVLRVETPLRHPKFFLSLFGLEKFPTSGQGWNPPDLACRPCLRANQLESLKAGYWGRITTDNPSLRDRLCDQSVQETCVPLRRTKIQLTPSDLESRKYSCFRNGTGRFSRGQNLTNPSL